MATEIKSEKKNVQDFLLEGQRNKFLIPDYQREYSWTEKQISKLFEDLMDYMETNLTKIENGENVDPYFLGCIVYYKNAENKLEIIDGQQRLTTLFLFLRALYDKISNDTTKEAKKQKDNISNLLWKTNALTGDVNKEDILLESKVATDKGKEILIRVLKEGNFDGIEEDDTNYSSNYLLIKDLIEEAFENQIMTLPLFILTNVIVIPIIANSQDSALQIFTTLNNRGLSLADADIFKSQIYKGIATDEEKEAFIKEWNKLNERVNSIEIEKTTLDRVFYYYMMYDRAKSGDIDTTTPKLRDYYNQKEKKSLLNCSNLLKELSTIIDFLEKMDFNSKKYSVNKFNNLNVEKKLNILCRYPNEWWKYPCVIYYLSHVNENTFLDDFSKFLDGLIKVLTIKYLEEPSISKIKPIVLKINQKVFSSTTLDELNVTITDKLLQSIVVPSKKIAPMLLAMLAYNDVNQNELLPSKLQKEHILPKKWKAIYNPDKYDISQIKEHIDHIGNYLPLEAKINVKASNEWLKIKKEKYRDSKIALVLNFEKNCGDTWDVEKIKNRDSEIVKKFKEEILA